ncbi:MAG: FtsX-like permease family protein [Aestuariivita sp.]|nr:FtsX-like permease family protein [Aestuariivita sp.]
MTLAVSANFAWRELRGGLSGLKIFLACLACGVAAITAIGTVRASIEVGLAKEGTTLLGGDAQMEFAYRFANDMERIWMSNNAANISEVVEFRSMLTVDRLDRTERGLTQIKAVDDAYPLKGDIILAPRQTLSEALNGRHGIPGAVIDDVLIKQMGLSIGDIFRLGNQDFVLTAELIKEPDNTLGGLGLGARTIVSTQALDNAGLLAPGTLFSTKYRLKLPQNINIADFKQRAVSEFEGTGMQWLDSRNGAPQTAEFVERLGAFLILVSLSGLAVGGIGISTSVNTYLTQKTAVIATLKTLGANQAIIFQTYFFQIGFLVLIGISVGLLLGTLLPWIFSSLLQSVLPFPIVFKLYFFPLIEATIYGILTSFIFSLWPLSRTRDVRASLLFRNSLSTTNFLPKFRYAVGIFILLATLILLAGWFSDAMMLTFWLASGIVTALTALSLVAVGIRAFARRLKSTVRNFPALRWAFSAISDPKEGTLPIILSLGLGLSVLATIGQVDGNLRKTISSNLPERAPSYFFIDIQRDQLSKFKQTVETDPAVSHLETASMIRGVITHINDIPAVDVAGEHWVLEGDRGITYSTEIPETTKLVEGKWWSIDYQGHPQVSFAAEEATELGLKIGDHITVNVLGRDIVAKVTSFREINFSNAGINFIMHMNPSALTGVPHSFISTVYAEAVAEARILRNIAEQFPNVTAIRVRDAIEQFESILANIANATTYGAMTNLVSGFLVLLGVAIAAGSARIYEAAILKTLGANRSYILISFALRSFILGMAAGGIALAVGIIGGWAISYYIFDTEFTIIWSAAIGIIFGGIVASLLAGLLFIWYPLSERPATVLRKRY